MAQGNNSQMTFDAAVPQLNSLAKEASDADASVIIRELDILLRNNAVKEQLDALLPYIATQLLLMLACRDSTREEILNILETLGIEPKDKLLNMVYPFGHKSEVAYSSAAYQFKAINLIGNKKEVSVEGVLKIVKALEISPDIKTAEDMVDFYRVIDKNNGVVEGENKQTSDPRIKSLYEMVYTFSDATYLIVASELARWASAPNMDEYWQRGIGYLFVAAALLAYTGRDLETDAIARIVASEDIDVDPVCLNVLSGLHIKNHIVYLVAISLLKMMGREATIPNITEIARTLYVQPDATITLEALQIFDTAIAGRAHG